MSYISDGFDEQIVELLKNGGVGFMPSDTVYGLSARALDEQAVERLHVIKLRDAGKPFIILISDVNQLVDLGVDASAGGEITSKYWPGALTIILPAPRTPTWLTKGLHTLAVRLPGKPELVELIRRIGPIVSTSANESGEPVVASVAEAHKVFGGQLDFYVDAGQLSASQPSTIVRPTPGGLQVLRRGTVKINDEGEES